MKQYIDMHIHTRISDGTMSPSEVVEEASKKGISILSITDHDSIAGIEEAKEVGENFNITIIPGIELRTSPNKDVEILGYFIDLDSIELIDYIKKIREKEVYWAIRTISKLKKQKVTLDVDKVINQSSVINYASIAQEIVNNGYANSIQEACDNFLNINLSDGIGVNTYTPEQCIRLIKQAKGLSFLAHPSRISNDFDEIFVFIKHLMNSGLNGIECYHPENSPELTQKLLLFANQNELFVSGGSDYHGKNKSYRMGQMNIPIDVFYSIANSENKYTN